MGTAWPPPELADVFGQQEIWSAWYAGTPEGLTDAYLNAPNDRPSARRKGFLARLGRWFWGQPTPMGERPAKLHVPLAGAIAATSANLLFGAPLNITVEDEATQERLDQLADDTTYAVLREAAEISAALGGVYLRAVWDQSIQDKPWLVAASPDIAVPEWKWGRLSAVTFWNVIREDANTVVRRLERHEPGWIRHSVWIGSANELGTQMALTDFPETAGLADIVIDGDGVPTGTRKLTAQYIPNLKPEQAVATSARSRQPRPLGLLGRRSAHGRAGRGVQRLDARPVYGQGPPLGRHPRSWRTSAKVRALSSTSTVSCLRR
ncbi:hypothetical protein [Streptomyces sp. NPDC001340]